MTDVHELTEALFRLHWCACKEFAGDYERATEVLQNLPRAEGRLTVQDIDSMITEIDECYMLSDFAEGEEVTTDALDRLVKSCNYTLLEIDTCDVGGCGLMVWQPPCQEAPYIVWYWGEEYYGVYVLTEDEATHIVEVTNEIVDEVDG